MRGMALGLSIVALIAVIFAFVVGYMTDGEINILLIAMAGVILSANLLVIKSRKNKSLKRDRAEEK